MDVVMKKQIVILTLFMLLPAFVFAETFKIETPQADSSIYSSQNVLVSLCGTDLSTVSFSMVCTDTAEKVDMASMVANETCYLGYYDASKFRCTRANLIANYKLKEKQTSKTISLGFRPIIDYPDSLLMLQKWDGSFGNSIETALAVWQLSRYGKLYSTEVNDALEWLKSNRDDVYKCWPHTGCTTRQTAKTLAYLNQASLDSTLRIKEDATAYLEERQNYISGTKWKINIDVSTDTNCTLKIDSATTEDTFYSNETTVKDLTAKEGTSVNLTCEDTASMWIADSKNKTVVQITRSDSIYYQIPGACWSSTKWQGCSLETTIYGAYNNINSAQKSAATKYLESQLTPGTIIGRYIPTSNDPRDNAFYLKSFGYKKDVENFLVFKQNNDGSFGDGTDSEKAVTTSHVIYGLESSDGSKTKEVVNDARKWLHNYYTRQSLDGTESLVMYFFANSNTDRKLIKFDRPFLNLSEKINITVLNPTSKPIKNLKVRTSGITGMIEVTNLTNLSAHNQKIITINPIKEGAGRYFGFIKFDVNSTTIAQLPVLIVRKSEFEVKPEKEYIIVGKEGTISINVVKSNSQFECTLDLGDLGTSKAKASKTLDFNVNFGQDERKSIEKQAKLSCVSGSEKISKDIALKIQHYPSTSIDISPEKLDMIRLDKEYYVTITNNLPEPIKMTADLKDSTGFLMIEESSFTIPESSVKNITIMNIAQEADNITGTAKLTFGYLGQKKEIDVDVKIIDRPFPYGLLAMIVVALALLAGLGYGAYYLNKNPAAISKVKGMFQKKKEQAFEQKKEYRDRNIEELIKIMKGLGKGDKQITERLKQEGLNEDQIKISLKNVEFELSGKQEIAKEKNVLKVIKALEDDQDTIRAQLKQKGFSDEQINQTLEEIDSEARAKEKDLAKKLGGSTQDED